MEGGQKGPQRGTEGKDQGEHQAKHDGGSILGDRTELTGIGPHELHYERQVQDRTEGGRRGKRGDLEVDESLKLYIAQM
jgi:hypothetical protein